MPGPLLGLIARLGVGAAGRGGARAAGSVAARRAGSRVGKDPARRATAQARLKRMQRAKKVREFKQGAKRFGKDVLEGALNDLNLNTDRIANNQRSPTGMLMRYLGDAQGAEGFDYNGPVLDRPEKVSRISNPKISSLEKQLAKLAETAVDLGVISRKQQENLLKDVERTEAAAQERQIEQPDATPIAAPGVGDAISPLDSEIEKLIAAISSTQALIDDKVRDAQQNSFGNSFMEGMLDSLGLGGVKKARAAKRAMPQVRKGFRQTRGGAFIDLATGKYAKPEQALKNFKTVDPTHLSKAAKARQATAVLGKSSGRVSAALGSAVARSRAGAGAAAKIGKDAIAKIAKPLVSKALVKTGIKSIPIVGAVAGGLFALGRLLQGDVVGAGLDAASGLAGPLTAIPALVLSLARDVYMGTFGVPPETDPQVGPRMAMVKGVVTELAEEALGKKVTDPQDTGAPATPVAAEAAVPAAPAAPAPAATPVAAPSATPGATAAPPSDAGAGAGGTAAGGGGGGAPPAAAEGGASAPAAGAGSTSGGVLEQSAASDTGTRIEGEEGTRPTPSGSAETGGPSTGERILQASTESFAPATGTGTPGMAPPRPATLPTTKGRARGMGDVPEPSYLNLGSIANQLYFGSVAGVMAT